MSEKQIVNYVPSPHDYIKVGKSAMVYPTNHPSYLVSNQHICHTSTVVAITEEGFETLNTLYRPTFTEYSE